MGQCVRLLREIYWWRVEKHFARYSSLEIWRQTTPWYAQSHLMRELEEESEILKDPIARTINAEL